ncbi:MAG: hypothetical protein NVS3B1_13850 [Marmoricola sp.]
MVSGTDTDTGRIVSALALRAVAVAFSVRDFRGRPADLDDGSAFAVSPKASFAGAGLAARSTGCSSTGSGLGAGTGVKVRGRALGEGRSVGFFKPAIGDMGSRRVVMR